MGITILGLRDWTIKKLPEKFLEIQRLVGSNINSIAVWELRWIIKSFQGPTSLIFLIILKLMNERLVYKH